MQLLHLQRFLLSLALLLAPVAAAEGFAEKVLGATFKLFHEDSTATCFLVLGEETDAALYLVSAAHVLERTNGETVILVLRERREDGSYARRDHTVHVREGDKELWVRDKAQDVAVLRLPEALPVPVEPLPATALAGEEKLKAAGTGICSPLFVLTFPQRFEANGAGFPVARQGIFASPPQLPARAHPTFLADFTTFAGDSGGPVFCEGPDGAPMVAGIVLAQNHHDETVKTEYEERKIHHPLGLGTVLRAEYVLDTLRTAAGENQTRTNPPTRQAAAPDMEKGFPTTFLRTHHPRPLRAKSEL